MNDQTMENMNTEKKKKKRFNLRNFLIVFIPAVVAVAAVVIVYYTTRKASEFRLSGEAYQTYAGGTRKIAGGSELIHDEETGQSFFMINGRREGLSDLPLYYKGRNAILTPEDVCYYQARSGMMRRLDYFSDVQISDSGSVHLVRGGREADPEQGFLYNGGDLYILLEPMELRWNGYEMTLDALSYVEVTPGDTVMVYDHANDKSYMEEQNTDVIAMQPAGDYSISMLYDSMTYSDGTDRLLFGRADKLDSIYE